MKRPRWLSLQLSLFCLVFSACAPVEATSSSNLSIPPTVINQLTTPFFTITSLVLTSTPTPTSTMTPTQTIVVPSSVNLSEHWAIISPDRASFWFKVDPSVVVWHWFSAPGPTYLEYEWGVEFPVNNEIYYKTFSAEVLLFYDRQIHPSSQKGGISDLLNACDIGLWTMERGGMSNAQEQFPNAVVASYFKGGILIELTNPTFISNLYEKRPESLLFKTFSYNHVLPNQEINVSVIYR